MNTISNNEKAGKWGVIGIIVGAIGASICCIGPLVLLALGVGGAWVGGLAAFETYRPIFMGITFIFLGFAFYQVYRKPKQGEACEPGSACATPQGRRFNKTALWSVTILALGLMAFPYLAPGLAKTAQQAAVQTASAEKVVLNVHNMTCGGCALTTQKSLTQLDGVISADVTFEPPQAVVVYDADKLSIADLTKATTNAGYPSEVKKQ